MKFKNPSYAGKKSAIARRERLEGREIGPRRLPFGHPLKVVVIYNPNTNECHRYETFKSFSGKRKIDLVIDRGTPQEKSIKGVSATWLSDLWRRKLAMLAEIEED